MMDEEIINIKLLEKDVQGKITAYRFNHTMGVVETAKDLAVIYGVDSYKATIAALLHDIAKEFTSDSKREFCKTHNIYVDHFLGENIHLTHGDIGAYIAKENYKVQDKEILNAILNHTLGSKNMSDLDKIIYVADIIEPSRKRHEELEPIRRMAYTDLNKAMLLALKYNINYLTKASKRIHPIIYTLVEEYENRYGGI